MEPPFANFNRAIQLHFNLLVGACNFPRVRTTQPVVGLFLLPTIPDDLLKNPVFVPEAVSHCRDLHQLH